MPNQREYDTHPDKAELEAYREERDRTKAWMIRHALALLAAAIRKGEIE